SGAVLGARAAPAPWRAAPARRTATGRARAYARARRGRGELRPFGRPGSAAPRAVVRAALQHQPGSSLAGVGPGRGRQRAAVADLWRVHRGLGHSRSPRGPEPLAEVPRVSRSMRALLCREWGPVESLTVADVAPPSPAPDQVLIAVKATAVNY